MPVTPSMNMVLPTEGDSNDVWGMLLNAALTNRVDSHRHVSGQGLPVPLDGIVVDQDKLWGSGGAFYALTDFKAITWHQQPVASMTPYVNALFVSDGTGGLSAGELYWRTSLGVNVKMTAANMLNVAGFAGGIGGDYTSAGAAVAYDDTAKQYTFREGIADLMGWAKLRAGALRISPFNTASSFFIEHTVDPTILTQYIMQWPATLPVSTQLMQVSSVGAVSFSNVVPQAITANGGISSTGAVNFSGASSFTRPPQTWPHNMGFAVLGEADSGGANMVNGGSTVGNVGQQIQLDVSIQSITLPIMVPAGLTLSSWGVRLQKLSASGTISCRLWENSDTSQVATQIGATQTNNANSPGFITIGQSGLSHPISATRSLFIQLNGGSVPGDTAWSYWVVA